MSNNKLLAAIIQTIRYFWMVSTSTLQTILLCTKISKILLGVVLLVIILACLFLLGLLGFYPAFMVILMEDFNSEIRILLIRVLFFIFSLGLLFPFLFLHESSKIFLSQNKIIAERIPNKLALEIKPLPNTASKDGKTIFLAALSITNTERKKIVELQALIHYDHYDFSPETNRVSQVSIEDNALLYWIGNNDTVEKMIDIRPEIPRTLVICEIVPALVENNRKINVIRMGSDIVRCDLSYARESIYQIHIMFQGKLEGEYEFKTFHYYDLIYGKPSENRILLSSHPELTFKDIPIKLLNRGQANIEYFKINMRINPIKF